MPPEVIQMGCTHKTSRSKKNDAYEEDAITQMKHTISNMTYSRTEADYKTHRDEFESLSTKDRCEDLWNRFQTNWDACCELWVLAHRVSLPHYEKKTCKQPSGKSVWQIKVTSERTSIDEGESQGSFEVPRSCRGGV
ncbi:hypothetical protein F441_09823, partial [Phytophthora nicotianae CJ01A1]